MFGALPASGRPSVVAATAVGTAQLATIAGPGLLWKTALTCASIFGITYDARPRNCGRKPLETSQYGLPKLMVDVCSPAPMARFNSGRLFRTSQKFDVVCPVLVPPCSVRPP